MNDNDLSNKIKSLKISKDNNIIEIYEKKRKIL
jgi:hypothetical protein